MGLFALPAIPVVVEGLLWLGATIGIVGTAHQVLPGKEQREQDLANLGNAIAGNNSAAMSNAQDDAKARAAPGTVAATCATGNCPPPPECKEKNKKVKERRDEMEKRYNDLLKDEKNLFYDYFSESNPHPSGYGSWEGHIRQYQAKQKNLRRLIQDAIDGGCKVDTPDAEEWATNEPPGAPDFRWPR